MLKLMGSAIILIASALFGAGRYSRYYERKRLLLLLRDGTMQVENSLRCACPPLYDCFLSGGEFFEKAALLISRGQSPEGAIKDVARNLCALKKSDIALVDRFAAGLSAEDLEGQLKNTAHFCAALEKNISEAETELNSRGKLVLKGSLLTATAVVILLI